VNDSPIASLQAALAVSPDNLLLRFMLIKAQLEAGQVDGAYQTLSNAKADEIVNVGDRVLAAEVCLAANEAERALSYLHSDEPRILLCKAKAFLNLGRQEEARTAYKAAIAANPVLEDPQLETLCRAKVVELRGAETRRLRVISNDDTDSTEAARLVEPEQAKITFADVGGLDEVKKQIHKKIILPFQKPSLFQKFRKRAGGGILLYGPPGCGKTLLARATAGECGAKFFNVAISDVLDMYIGESERKLHAIFELARSSAPAVMFFDEVEALGGKRQHSREAVSSKLVSQFLSELDGFAQNNSGVLILAATNVPWALDPAFRRPGRFDRMQFIPPPDYEARISVLKILLSDRPLGGTIDYAFLAKNTSGFSGADLSNLVESAVDEAIEASLSHGEDIPLTNEHLKAALRDVKPTTLEWLTTARNYARYANEGGQYNDVLNFLEKYGK